MEGVTAVPPHPAHPPPWPLSLHRQLPVVVAVVAMGGLFSYTLVRRGMQGRQGLRGRAPWPWPSLRAAHQQRGGVQGRAGQPRTRALLLSHGAPQETPGEHRLRRRIGGGGAGHTCGSCNWNRQITSPHPLGSPPSHYGREGGEGQSDPLSALERQTPHTP